MEESTSNRSINVKFRPSIGDGFDYSFDPGQLTVRQLKENLVSHTTIPSNTMRLVYSGRVLKDEDMVDLYGVKEGHTIHVVRGADNRAAEQAANVPPTTSGQRNINNSTTMNNPFGMNPFGNFDQDLMRSMMNSPMIRHILSNPEIVRTMVMQNPTMRQMIERNPEIGHIINDPSFIRQTMDMARNPELMREMMRNNDRALANLETIPGGFNHLRRMYHTLQEPLESAGRNNDQSSEAANRRLAEMLNVERPPQGRINNTPLPNPWAPRNNTNSSTSPANTPNLFGGIPSFGLMGFPSAQMSFPSPSSASRTNSTQGSNQSTTPNSTNGISNATSPTNAPGNANFPNINLPQNLPTSTRIDIVSEASKLRRGRGRVPDYMLKNRDETCIGVFCEVTSPKRQDEEHKVYWDIYRGSIHAKDSIDFVIKQREMHPDETNQIVIFINGHKMEVESCTIPKTVRDLRSLIKLHQILMSIRVGVFPDVLENAIDLLGERSHTTPLQTNYSKWLRPTADTPSARTENYLSVLRKN